MIHNVSQNDLRLKLGGQIVPIEGIHKETRPRRIVILLDASGSMSDESTFRPWRQALDSASLLARLSEGRAQVALVIFNDKIVEEIGFSQDNSRVAKRLVELQNDSQFAKSQIRGRTRLYDTLNRGLELLSKPTSADLIYLASDGEDTNSRISASSIEQRIVGSGVRIFVSLPLRIAVYRNRTPEEGNSLQRISEIIRNSGGDFMQVTSTGLSVNFQVRPKIPPVEGARLFYQGMFENDVIQISVPLPDSKKRTLALAPAPSSTLATKSWFFYPQELYHCSP